MFLRFIRAFVFTCAAALAAMASAEATVLPTTSVTAVRAKTPPPQDASLADPIWATALRADNFENVTTKSPAKDATTALLLFDDHFIYVGFIAEQKNSSITTTQSTNDVGYGLDDSVTVAVDTSGGNSRQYGFTATPLGVRYEYASESSRYQPPWRVVSKIGDGGYRVMMTIPLADLKLAGGPTKVWRVNFSRRVASTNNVYSWAWEDAEYQYCQQRTSTPTTGYCDSTGWPHMGGLDIASVGRPPAYADVYGLESFGSDRRRFETTPLGFREVTPRTLGIDATLPLTNTLSFVGALGPDFSNVESDQTTIVPQEFALQYREFRPFFAQGASFLTPLPGIGITSAPNSNFYTPSLGVVDAGEKIEGTVGLSSVGLLNVRGDGFNDRDFGYRFKRADGSLTLSMQGVDAEHPGVSDRTLGVGGTYEDVHSGLQQYFSYSREAGTQVGRSLEAQSLFGAVGVTKGSLQVLGFYQDVGPQFLPVDGYTANPDVRGPGALIQYSGVPKGGALKSDGFFIAGDRYLDRSGAAHQSDVSASATFVTRHLFSVSLSVADSELRTYATAYPAYAGPRTYSFDQGSVSVGYRDGTPAPVDATYSFGPFAVFCPGIGVEPLSCRQAQNGFVQAYVNQLDASTTRTLGGGLSATLEFGGTVERALTGLSDSQWLRRLSLTRPLGVSGQVSLALRLISGTGGFARPGETLAVSYQKKFADRDRLFVEFGSPASSRTLNRFILKYVHHVGKGGAGT